MSRITWRPNRVEKAPLTKRVGSAQERLGNSQSRRGRAARPDSRQSTIPSHRQAHAKAGFEPRSPSRRPASRQGGKTPIVAPIRFIPGAESGHPIVLMVSILRPGELGLLSSAPTIFSVFSCTPIASAIHGCDPKRVGSIDMQPASCQGVSNWSFGLSLLGQLPSLDAGEARRAKLTWKPMARASQSLPRAVRRFAMQLSTYLIPEEIVGFGK